MPQSLCQKVLFSDIVANNENATDSTRFVDRTIPVSPPNILASTVARHRHELIHVPRGTFAFHDEFYLRADYIPYFLPTIPATLAERGLYQLLRAEERGTTRLENPNCYEIRKMYHKYVQGWVLYLQ